MSESCGESAVVEDNKGLVYRSCKTGRFVARGLHVQVPDEDLSVEGRIGGTWVHKALEYQPGLPGFWSYALTPYFVRWLGTGDPFEFPRASRSDEKE